MLEEQEQSHEVIVDPDTLRARWYSARRVFGAGCAVLLLLICGGLVALGAALHGGGPVVVNLPGHTALKLGSEPVVLSNYSFQNGTTYFLDLRGNGVRNILEVHDLADSHSFELVFHNATTDTQHEQQIFTLPHP